MDLTASQAQSCVLVVPFTKRRSAKPTLSGIRNHHRQREPPEEAQTLDAERGFGSSDFTEKRGGGGERPVVGMLGFPRDS